MLVKAFWSDTDITIDPCRIVTLHCYFQYLFASREDSPLFLDLGWALVDNNTLICIFIIITDSRNWGVQA